MTETEKHNDTYLTAWERFQNKQDRKAVILLTIGKDESLGMNTLDIDKEVMIDMLKDAIKVLDGTMEGVDTHRATIKK